jgi:glycosyltransferase involved in cell wall biosynthesis
MDPDVIYSQTIVSPWGLYCAERLNKPHALGVSEFGKLDHNLEFIFGYEDSMRLLYENSQAVFWIADIVKDQFRPFLNPSSKSKVEDTIYSRIEIPSSMMPQAGYASRHQDHLFKIGIFGRIYEGKGQEDIAKAALEIKNRKIPAKIFLVGSPNHEYVNKIKRLMENDGTADMLEIVEYQENPYRMMSEMDVIVSCSKNEAMGRTLVEAALLEIPIIFPDRGGPAEIFKDNIHGLAYPPGYHLKLAENIASIYNDPAAARERVYRTKEYVVKKFSRESYSGKVKAGLMKVKESWGGRTGHGTFDFLFNNRSAAFDVLFLSKFYRLIYAITNSYR